MHLRTNPHGRPDSHELWQKILDVNLTGSYLVSRAALELMTSGGGRIDQPMSSVLVDVTRRSRIREILYCACHRRRHLEASRAGPRRSKLAPRGITVNAICPGWVETDSGGQRYPRETIAEALGITADALSRCKPVAGVPLKRFLDPKEIADRFDPLFELGCEPPPSAAPDL